MDDFLSRFIEDTPRAQRKLVQSVLADAIVEKGDIDELANAVSRNGNDRTLLMQREQIYSRISGPKISSNFRGAEEDIRDMFERSNAISTLLSSVGDILGSEIRSLNKDIDVVEKSIKNYAFLLADGLAYDYAFLEPFSDTSNFDISSVVVKDRDNSVFTSEDHASINTDDGTLIISDAYNKTYPLSPSIAFKNFSFDIGQHPHNLEQLDDVRVNSWLIDFSAPTPLMASLSQFKELYGEEYSGALIAVDYNLSQPAPCDSISIDPVSGDDFDIVQIVVYYADDEASTKSILSKPQTLDNKKTFYFPTGSVKKIRCYYRQISYVRKYEDSSATSTSFNRIYSDQNRNNAMLTQKLDSLNSIITVIRDGKWNKDSRPKFSYDKYENGKVKIPPAGSLRSGKFGHDTGRISPLLLAATVKNIDDHKIIDLNKSGVGRTVSGLQTYTPAKVESRVTAKESDKPIVKSTSFRYQYSFGIKDVKIGLSTLKGKGVYVSGKLPSPGDIGELKLISAEENPTDHKLDNPLLTSVEYSVSNVSKPSLESDWVPILPSGVTSVLSERMLFDESGKSYFRFTASYNDNIVIYKNGNAIDITPFGKQMLDGQGNIVGIQIDTQFYTSRDIFTCYYTPAQDPNVVNFEASGFETPPLVAMSDKDGPGEGFDSTGGQLSVNLKNYPFIDFKQAAEAVYTPIYGMNGYGPISVKFEDGTTAYNLTNYVSPVNQAALDPNSAAVTFIHSKNVLMFNRAVTSKFRVYYQYLPANTRVRVVLRSNTDKFVTPKVDYYQVKSKTRLSNSSSSL